MCLACLFRLMDLRTRYTHVFSALASGRSASWAKLVMGETRGYRREEIAKGSEENIRDVLTLFKELEKQGRLGIDRLHTLKEILTRMKKRSLLQKVEEFEIRRKGI